MAALPASAAAQPRMPTAEQKETARNLMHIGDGKLAAGDDAGALEAYESADAIMRVPTTGLAVGRVRTRLGMLVEAIDALQRVARYPETAGEAAAYRQARDQAKKLDADLARRIPTVKVVVAGPARDTPVEVTIDGAPVPSDARAVPRRVNPGRHIVGASAPGYREAETAVRVAEQEHVEVELRLEAMPRSAPAVESHPKAPERAAAADPASAVPRVLTIAGFAVGGVGLAVGIGTGVASMLKTSELEERCGGSQCPAGEEGEHDSIVALANASNAGFAIGAAGIAVGVVGLVLDLQGDDDEEARIVPLLGPGVVGFRGRF